MWQSVGTQCARCVGLLRFSGHLKLKILAAKTAFSVRYLFAPFFVIFLATLLGYSLLNWALLARTNLVSLPDDVVGVWLPSVVSLIVVRVLVRPRLLAQNPNRKFVNALLQSFAVVVVAIPTQMAQRYVRTATGGLTHVEAAAEIAVAPVTRYYTASRICIAYDEIMVKTISSRRGSKRQFHDLETYVVAPICSEGLLRTASRKIWLGQAFHNRIDSRLPIDQEKIVVDSLVRRAEIEFRHYDPQTYQYLEVVGRNDARRAFESALRRADQHEQLESAIILIPHHELFATRNRINLTWTVVAFGVGTLVSLMLVLSPLISQEKPGFLLRVAESDGQRHGFLKYFIPLKRSYGLPILIDLNMLVYLLMVLAGLGLSSFRLADLIEWGANYRPALHGVGWLRLVASQFIHGGFAHLFNNLIALLAVGTILSNVLGSGAFIACYLIAGLVGGAATMLVHPTQASYGASSAIFGLVGILLVLLVLKDPRITSNRGWYLLLASVFLGVNVFIENLSNSVEFAGHVGGLVTGLLLGIIVLLRHRLKR